VGARLREMMPWTEEGKKKEARTPELATR
jgi:hypothetical protein